MRAHLAVSCALAAAVTTSAAHEPGPQSVGSHSPRTSPCADAGQIVQRAVAYVAGYAEQLGSLVAREDYHQEALGAFELPSFTPPPIAITGNIQVQPATPMTTRPRVTERLRSSFLFVRLSDGPGWVGFREVLEVNGKRIGRDASTREALERVGESALERWRRLSEESARYNLGTITRTLNVPTFTLLVLHGDNQSRFAFTSAGEQRDGGVTACSVAFQETESPTIIRSGVGGDLPASGMFLIEPGTGRVLHSELIAGSTATGVASRVIVRYERDRKLGAWVPREMREEYVAASGERLQCTAKYSEYRRAEVTARVRPEM